MYFLNRKSSFDWKAWLGWIFATLAGIELCVLCLYHLVSSALIDKFPSIGLLAILATARQSWARPNGSGCETVDYRTLVDRRKRRRLVFVVR